MKAIKDRQEWDDVLDFWFPEGRSLNVDAQAHSAHWFWRMQGGADDEIMARFSDLTQKAADGELDHWALDPHGRLALIVILDQFSRSVWRDVARAYARDPHALSLAIEGFSNGHYSSLETPWFQVVYGLPLGHCEGPDHLQRLDLLISVREEIAAAAPISLRPMYSSLVKHGLPCFDLCQARDALDDPTEYRLFRRRNLSGSFISIRRVLQLRCVRVWRIERLLLG